MAVKKKKKQKKVIAPEEQEKRNHKNEIRSIFRNAGFVRITKIADKEFKFKNTPTDFDDVFVFENIIVLAEYTTAKSSNISGHLKPKKIVYDEILNSSCEFIEFLEETFPSFKEERDKYFDAENCKIIILYCSKNIVDSSHKEAVPKIRYLDYPIVKYFKSIAEIIKHSVRPELFSFLGLESSDIGKAGLQTAEAYDNYNGSILPHTSSNFAKGYKVVSFYVDPKALLKRAYVLRRDGWKKTETPYQRMLSKAKIVAIRKYLNSKERVFINNIIITLPSGTKLLNKENDTVDPALLTKTEPVTIQIPNEYAAIGLIDGQHRVFSYHEGGAFEEKISLLREKQNLLATGIIYPKHVKARDKIKFEAKLFLEINSTQTNAKSDLIQDIKLILDPFLPDSMAKALINKLNETGPLAGEFERFFYDTDKIKTTSIVSYGLKPIVKLSGEDSFYKVWNHPEKEKLELGKDDELLQEYLKFCQTETNKFLSAVKAVVDQKYWTTNKDVKGRMLTTTVINGLIICLRQIIEHDSKLRSIDYYKSKLQGLNPASLFPKYHSSQYGAMGREMYKKFFTNN